MSIAVMSYVWEHSTHKGTELLLMLAISDFADKRGIAFPSVGTLADRIRMSERNTQRVLVRLRESGELRIKKNGGPSGTHLFQVVINESLPLFHGDGGDKLTGDKLSPDKPGGRGVTQLCPVSPDTAMSPEPSLTVSKPPMGDDGVAPRVDKFDEAWAKYPKRIGNNPKLDARKAWTARVREKVSEDVMAVAVDRYAAFCSATGKVGTEHVLRASTFFGPSKPFEQDWALPTLDARGKVVSAPGEWWKTMDGLMAKAKALGVERTTYPDVPEHQQQTLFLYDVYAAAGDGPWLNKRSEAEQRLYRDACERREKRGVPA